MPSSIVSTAVASQWRRYSTYIVAHPNSGTSSPAFRVPNRFEDTPTTQGRRPPPTLESTNITEPIRDDAFPNSWDSSEIVMGYTAARPSPVAQALATTAGNPCENSSPVVPAQASSSPEIGRAS